MAPMTTPALRIGTRGSPLALAQTEEVRLRLAAARPEMTEPGAVEVVDERGGGRADAGRCPPG